MLSRKTTFFILALSAAGIVLSGCGRKGDLDRPGATNINRKAAPGEKEQKAPAPDRPFLLDPLL